MYSQLKSFQKVSTHDDVWFPISNIRSALFKVFKKRFVPDKSYNPCWATSVKVASLVSHSFSIFWSHRKGFLKLGVFYKLLWSTILKPKLVLAFLVTSFQVRNFSLHGIISSEWFKIIKLETAKFANPKSV